MPTNPPLLWFLLSLLLPLLAAPDWAGLLGMVPEDTPPDGFAHLSPADRRLVAEYEALLAEGPTEGRERELLTAMETLAARVSDPDVAMLTRFKIARHEARRGRPEAALRQYRLVAASDLPPNYRREATFGEAEYLIKLGRTEEALAAAKRLPHVGPGGLDSHDLLRSHRRAAELYLNAGRPAAAQQHFLSATPPDGDDHSQGDYLADGIMLANFMSRVDAARAANLSLNVLKKVPGAVRPRHLQSVAYDLRKLGNAAGADALENITLSQYPASGEAALIYERRAERALTEAGDRLEAARNFAKLSRAPGADARQIRMALESVKATGLRVPAPAADGGGGEDVTPAIRPRPDPNFSGGGGA